MIRLIGHANAWKHVAQMVDRRVLPHALFFYGPRAVGKTTFSHRLAQLFLCSEPAAGAPCGACASCVQVEHKTHPDMLWLSTLPNAQDITIDQVRGARSFVSLRSLDGSRRVVMVEDAERMNREAANALLKSLEEPEKHVAFILVSHNPKLVLPTIRSRCLALHLGLVGTEELLSWLASYGVARAQAAEYAALAAGRPGIAVTLAAQGSASLAERYVHAGYLLNLFRGSGFVQVVQAIEQHVGAQAESAAESREWARNLLSVWQEVTRDLYLALLGRHQYLRYQKFKNEVTLLSSGRPLGDWLKALRLMRKAESRLAANAHVRLTLEWLSFSLQNL